MPNITVELVAGRTREQRAEFVARLTDLACEVLDTHPAAVRILFREHTMDMVSREGRLRSDIDGAERAARVQSPGAG